MLWIRRCPRPPLHQKQGARSPSLVSYLGHQRSPRCLSAIAGLDVGRRGSHQHTYSFLQRHQQCSFTHHTTMLNKYNLLHIKKNQNTQTWWGCTVGKHQPRSCGHLITKHNPLTSPRMKEKVIREHGVSRSMYRVWRTETSCCCWSRRSSLNWRRQVTSWVQKLRPLEQIEHSV